MMPTPAGYSRTQISLHWLIAALILFQVIFGEEIGTAFRSLVQTGVATYGLASVSHIVAGVAVLLFGLWRIALRVTRGAPALPPNQSRPKRILAHAVHGLLYAMMVIAPVTGLWAWFGASRDIAELHEFAKPAIIVLVALHVIGALWHHFVLKDGLLLRMRRAAK